MQAMQRAGCTHLQGWLFAKALPAEKIEAMVALGRLSATRSDQATNARPERRAVPRRGRGRLKRA
jgi:hypothetical protein